MSQKLWLRWVASTQQPNANRGFVLPMTVVLGMAMIILGLTGVMLAQSDRNQAVARKQSNTSLAVAEGAADRVLSLLSNRNNSILLGRNYDPEGLLGADGRPNSGDESLPTAKVDEWTGYNPSDESCFQQAGVGAPNLPVTGSIGTEATFTLKAYRYDPTRQQGILLVEGRYRDQSSAVVALTISAKPDFSDFPGVLLIDYAQGTSIWQTGVLGLRGRDILGSKGNVYLGRFGASNPADSALTGSSAPGDANRANFLNAIWSSADDGAVGDTVAGKIFACNLLPQLPAPPNLTSRGTIDTTQTLEGTAGRITHYRVDRIILDGDETLTVDTTAGPVYLHLQGTTITSANNYLNPIVHLSDQAKILNTRTDSKLPQVGDLRLLVEEHNPVRLDDQSCIQNAFLWIPSDELHVHTSNRGCPGTRNTNFEGVIWAEAIFSYKNDPANRPIDYLNYTSHPSDTFSTGTPTNRSGFYVPDDLSSLNDLLPTIAWPARYQFGGVTNWQQVRL